MPYIFIGLFRDEQPSCFLISCFDKSASVRAEWGVGLRHKGLRAQRRVKGREREGKRGGMK